MPSAPVFNPGSSGGGGGGVSLIESTDGSIPTITNPSGPTVNLTGTGTIRNIASSSLSVSSPSGPNTDLELPNYNVVYADMGATPITPNTTPLALFTLSLNVGLYLVLCNGIWNGETTTTTRLIVGVAPPSNPVGGTATYALLASSGNGIGSGVAPNGATGTASAFGFAATVHVTVAGTIVICQGLSSAGSGSPVIKPQDAALGFTMQITTATAIQLAST